ncbi:MAG: DNA/RNA non-specific endonuclease [Bacteroidota bacterium]
MRCIIYCCLLIFANLLLAQAPPSKLSDLEQQLTTIEKEKAELLHEIELAQLALLHQDLVANGLPKVHSDETVIHHQAFSLVYSEAHEQAKWVAHVISPKIVNGSVTRTNDFRIDPLVATETAVEEDYFIRIEKDGQTEYDGFGWDRGHLAPSADFRWSKIALSESYFYSNMSPQVPAFNRDSWAKVENLLRAYVYAQEVPLYVVTGGLLTEDLSVIERSINKVSIPNYFWKVAVDLQNKKGIAFLLPNAKADYPTEYCVKSIDEIEQLTGIDFYASLEDELEKSLESQKIASDWIIEVAKGDVPPLDYSLMPAKHFNTVMGSRQIGKKKGVHICGKVVRSRTTRKGNVMFNLDKAYPNEIFNVFIKKDDLIHFENNPIATYTNQEICAFGEVGKIGRTPTVYVADGKKIKLFLP